MAQSEIYAMTAGMSNTSPNQLNAIIEGWMEI